MDKKEKKVTQFLVDKYATEWLKENKEFVEDYTELCSELLFFKAKWGVEIGFIFRNPKEVKSRELGVGLVEELFSTAQRTESSQ